ncbi:MAG: tetratricopeptide repeat protein [Acidobacteria bacterium]|nr:tetratricopeptide repeat protein [Acidobacteriota bacterium]
MKYESYKSPSRVLFRNILAKGEAATLTEYRQARKGSPKSDLVNESQMNQLGYDLLRAQRIQDAINVFKQNTEDYPQSSNVYDSLAEAYARDGQKELAIKNYQRALELDPKNDNALQELKKLQVKQ